MVENPGGMPPVPPPRPTPRGPQPAPGAAPGAAPADAPGGPPPTPGAPGAPAGHQTSWMPSARPTGPVGTRPLPRIGAMAAELERLHVRLERALTDAAVGAEALAAAFEAWLGHVGARETRGDDLLELAPPGTPAAAALVAAVGPAIAGLPPLTIEELHDGLPADDPARAGLLLAYDEARTREG